MSARVRSVVRRLTRGTRELMHGHDLWLASAGAAFYGALTVGPSVLVAISLAQVVLGRDRVHGYGGALARALPKAIRAGTPAPPPPHPRVAPPPIRGGFPLVR